MKHILLVLLYLFLPIALISQKMTGFSDQTSLFLKELGEFMTASKNSGMEEVYKGFEKGVSSGYYSQDELDRIRHTCNQMLSKRLSANPNFTDYLEAVPTLKLAEGSEQRFMVWHDAVDSLLNNIENRKLKPLQDFFEFSSSFFRTGALRSSKLGTTWQANANHYAIAFEQKLPIIKFEQLDLLAFKGGDSILIKNTSGNYSPVEKIFRGSGGNVSWERLGLDREVYAELGDFELETDKSLYEVNNVRLHYPLYFGSLAVAGTFSDKVSSQNQATQGSYPRFESKEKVLEISNIGEGVLFKGGFRLEGTTVYGFGTQDSAAVLTLYNPRKEIAFRAKSDLFAIKQEERIIAEGVESTLYFGQDSLYHPSVNLRFEIPRRILQLSRGKRGSDRNLFYHSLHQVNIDVEKIDYYLDRDSVLIGSSGIGLSKSNAPVVFESLKFFEESDYTRLQNISSTNPIASMKLAYQETGERVLDANYLAQRLNPKFSVENITSLLYDLVSKGFINYNAGKQEVELKDKIFHYAEASQKKVDFDFLRISSETTETNAVFDLKDNKMLINGVSSLEFSRPQLVSLKPYGNVIRMGKNRDMDFDGRLFAGLGILTGKDFHFDYNAFAIRMDSVRYFDLFLPTGVMSSQGIPLAYSIGSRLEHLNGVLLIDAPSNKSGREDIGMFPSLESKRRSFVYYDYPKVQQGVYARDSFYFELYPFSLNSLDRFTQADVKFKGKLHSANIFSPFEETLLIREDTSLGFVALTPPAGYATYLGKGRFAGSIDLSNQGLLGKGVLSYLSANIDSRDFVFKPTQLQGSAERFDQEEDRKGAVKVPQVKGVDVTIDWRPYKDSLYIASKTAPFALFKQNNHKLKGTLILTPSGLKGSGSFEWDKASMQSMQFSFGAYSVSADSTELRIKALNADALALTTSNLNGTVDFDAQLGRFRANEEFMRTTLSYNQYQTSFNEFDWNMKSETVDFKTLEGKLGSFLSIHPDQDSLNFQGSNANYDLKTNLLKIGGVPYIVSADAFIYPKTGNIEVQPGAVISEITDARIIADTISKYHVINRARVQILGRKEYRASGYYEYKVGNKNQEIEFAEITGTRVGGGSRSEKKSATRAKAEISQRSDFYIDHKTKFQGTISLSSEKPNLSFKGFAQLKADKLPSQEWFSVNCEGDKNDLAIPYAVPLNPEGEQLYTGIFVSKESATIYPRVMMPLYFRKDRQVIAVKGLMQYDEKTDRFTFGDSLLVGAKSGIRGDQLVFNNKNGKISIEGRLNFGTGLKYVSVDAAGSVQAEFATTPVDTAQGNAAVSKVSIKAMIGARLILPQNLEKIIAADLKSSSFESNPIVYALDMPYHKKVVSDLFPANEEMNRVVDEISLGSLDIPRKYNPYTFLFDNVPLIWDRDYQSFVSRDEKLGLVSIGGEMINTNVTAYLEIRMPSNEDDRLYFYIKSPSQSYYFFGYKQGILNVVSNNTRFMEELLGMKEKEKIFKMPDGEQYEIQPVEPSTAQAFINRVKAAAQAQD